MDLRNLDEYMALAGLPAGTATDETVVLPVGCAESAPEVNPFIQSALDLGLNVVAANHTGAVACRLVLPSLNFQGDPVA